MLWRTAAPAVLSVLLAMSGAAGAAAISHGENDPRRHILDCEWIGDIDKSSFNEPSGIVYHPSRGTLFVVGDEGDICEIETDGSLVKQTRVRPGDFEGITCDPRTGLLYVAIEGEEKILEIHPDDFRVLREFAIDRAFQGKVLLAPGGQGVEAITFVPDARHPHGGTFYLSNQAFSLDLPEDPSIIFEVEVPLREKTPGTAAARILRYFSPGITDFAALHYDGESDHLYAVSDSNNLLVEMSRAGEFIDFWAFPGANQEGFAMDEAGFVYIAQDHGGIIKLKWDRKERQEGEPAG